MSEHPSSDPLWYKDAIIYQLHVKAFFDGNNDGIGDFAGLTGKLDYLESLGVNTLWLLPFYPSPLRDDGYDIADYRDIHPAYGTMDDFRHFIEQAHARGLRVITELVVNHTSDQHAWFQRARNAPAGSPERDFYVWSDSDQAYSGTRIIFSDTETSNWAWDPVAKQYYWHRFFSHQPDLNFDNPAVLGEIIEVMYFWLELGVDGLRLDAVPYLCEREGTNNENLEETHAIIRTIRAALDARYQDRLLLAEANQWPEDVQAYFGNGDECHMAFHFPLMPRLYMAVAQEDRHPITDIMYQTPDIPPNCQWAMFLRNHDELTLEMVTDRERDYLWNYYANDKRARINFGIRRRLSPLMQGDRRKVELLNSLLMSMPGTPILYYGDEIGMGDNIFLGDRDGVRTPMQWSPDRNGGFSKADPARLYLPSLMDPVYGFQSLNVEAQAQQQNSLLNWTRNLLAVRGRVAFGRGSLRFLTPANRKVLAYLCTHEGKSVLCIANLSHAPQPVELELNGFKGHIPVEMLSESAFPAIGELPYFVTLSPYGFYWFQLMPPGDAAPAAQALPELITLVARKGFESLDREPALSALEDRLLPAFLSRQRWYRKRQGATELKLAAGWTIDPQYELWLLSEHQGEHVGYYVLACGIAWESLEDNPLERLSACTISRVRQVNRVGILYEASGDEHFIRALMKKFAAEETLASGEAMLHFTSREPLQQDDGAIKPLGREQTNSSALVGERILKLIRQPQPGINIEEEITAYLTARSFRRTAQLLGSIRAEGIGGGPITLGLLQSAIRNQGDGWTMTLDYLSRLAADPAAAVNDYYSKLAQQLGRRTAELHQALAGDSQADFAPEDVTAQDREDWIMSASETAQEAFQHVENAVPKLAGEAKTQASLLLGRKDMILDAVAHCLPEKLQTRKTRVHGDFHLGQVLVTENDFTIIDFEGEPTRGIEARRRKTSPYKDVAGMLRSFDYAATTALRQAKPATEEEKTKLAALLNTWRGRAAQSFLQGYGAKEEDAAALTRFFLLEKALYEIAYEAQHRPDWLPIPIHGVISLLQGGHDA